MKKEWVMRRGVKKGDEGASNLSSYADQPVMGTLEGEMDPAVPPEVERADQSHVPLMIVVDESVTLGWLSKRERGKGGTDVHVSPPHLKFNQRVSSQSGLLSRLQKEREREGGGTNKT